MQKSNALSWKEDRLTNLQYLVNISSFPKKFIEENNDLITRFYVLKRNGEDQGAEGKAKEKDAVEADTKESKSSEAEETEKTVVKETEPLP